MSRWRKIMAGLVCSAMFGLLLLVVFGDNGLVELKKRQYMHKALLDRNTQLTAENALMYTTIDRLKGDSVYIENIARQELGMIRADELIFKFKNNSNSQK